MADHTFDIAAFRIAYPQFADVDFYPDATLNAWWAMATCAISDADNCYLHGDCLQTALNLMTAHMGMVISRAAEGNMSVGTKSSATIDKVTVAYTVPSFKNGWQAWLGQTPYGLMLLAMLQAKSAGGFYFGGRPETLAFRKVGGYFR